MKTKFQSYTTPELELTLVSEAVVLCQSASLDPLVDNTGDIDWNV